MSKLDELRKAAAVEFLDAMKNHPKIVAERISWLLAGNYGYGVMLLARQRRIQGSPRMNRLAALTHIIGLHEWGCPQAMAIAAWKKLSSAEKARLDKNIEVVIRQSEREDEREHKEE